MTPIQEATTWVAVIGAIKKSPDALHGVIYTGGATEAVLLAQEMKKAGLTLPIIGGEDLFSAEYLKGGDAVNETLMYTTFLRETNQQNGRVPERLWEAQPRPFCCFGL